jgi:hypothetical protein
MDSPVERPCPSCAAPATASQRWCLECGAEIAQRGRGGLRSVVGIATALTLLIGAGSAGGYTLLQDGRKAPPPPQTVAQQPPPATTTPATEEPLPYDPSDVYTPPSTPTTGGTSSTTTPTTTTPTTTVTTPTTTPTVTTPTLVPVNIALGATAVVYAPYAADDVDLGDPSRAVDDTTRTAWKTPLQADPTASPQVGVYVDLAGLEQIRKLLIWTSTPGMALEVYAARKGPPEEIVDEDWQHIATRKHAKAKTRVAFPTGLYRYVLVWIVGLPPDKLRAAISELALISLQPE